MYVELYNKYVMIQVFSYQWLSQLLNWLMSQLVLLVLFLKLNVFRIILFQEITMESCYGQFRGEADTIGVVLPGVMAMSRWK